MKRRGSDGGGGGGGGGGSGGSDARSASVDRRRRLRAELGESEGVTALLESSLRTVEGARGAPACWRPHSRSTCPAGRGSVGSLRTSSTEGRDNWVLLAPCQQQGRQGGGKVITNHSHGLRRLSCRRASGARTCSSAAPETGGSGSKPAGCEAAPAGRRGRCARPARRRRRRGAPGRARERGAVAAVVAAAAPDDLRRDAGLHRGALRRILRAHRVRAGAPPSGLTASRRRAPLWRDCIRAGAPPSKLTGSGLPAEGCTAGVPHLS